NGQTYRKVGTQSHRSKGGFSIAEPRIAGLPKQVNNRFSDLAAASPVMHTRIRPCDRRALRQPSVAALRRASGMSALQGGEHTPIRVFVMCITRYRRVVGYS